MRKKIMYGITIFIIIILIGIVITLDSLSRTSFTGLQPKAIYKNYKIYDIVEQKNLACAQAVEMLDSDGIYDYYFPCMKSDKIYFVSDNEVITVKEAYERGIISKQKLFELGIVDRMVKLNG